MRIASRTIGVLAAGRMLPLGRVLAAGLLAALLVGCGSKPTPTPEPQPPNAPAGGEATPTAPEVKPEPPPQPVHELDADKHKVPAAPVSGRLGGSVFTPSVAVEGDHLVFQETKPGSPVADRSVRLKLGNGPQGIQNRKLVVRSDGPAGPDLPEVMLQTPKRPEILLFGSGYALTLELGTRTGGKLPGRVYLSLPDEDKSFFAGTFEADFPRQPTEPPGPDDVPFVNGTVTVRNAPPAAVLIVGYASTPTPTSVAFGSAEIGLGEPVVPPRWVQSVYDKPRVTNLVGGDGKDVPSRYEHSRLTPGRYLIFATLKNGPAAWKWLDVPENGTVRADLTIDAAQTGGLEIGVPLEAVGKVQLAPADEPGRPATDPNLFIAICWQLGLEQPIVARKALYKNLTPGRYEVRTAGRSAVVEVVAGKTVEFDFDKKPPPPKPEVAPEPKPRP